MISQALPMKEIFGMGATMSQSISHDSHPQLLALRPRNLTALEAASLPTVSLYCLYGLWFCSSDSWWNSIDPCSSRWSRSCSYFCCQTFGSTVDGNSRFCKEDVQFKISWSSSNCFLTWWPSILIGYLWSTYDAHVGFWTRWHIKTSFHEVCHSWGRPDALWSWPSCRRRRHVKTVFFVFFFLFCFSTSKILRTIIWLLFWKGELMQQQISKCISQVKDMFGKINMRREPLAFNLVHGRLNQNNTQI